jgi:hypothetical protein
MDYVLHDHDGDIQITCSGDDHDFSNPDQVHVVGLGHLIARDPTLLEVPELYRGTWTERSDIDRQWRQYSADGGGRDAVR